MPYHECMVRVTRKRTSRKGDITEVGYTGDTPLPDPKWELFCMVYTTNTMREYWAHAQNSYLLAWGREPEIHKLEDQIDHCRTLMGGKKRDRRGKSIAELEREIVALNSKIKSITRAAASCASDMLTKPHVKARVAYLLDKLATNLIVDRELTYMIQQRDNLDIKMSAIEHYNKVQQRLRERVDMRHEFQPITGMEYVKPEKPTKAHA